MPSLTGGDTAPPASAGQRDLTLGVGPVTVPPYLDRPQIVTRTSRAKLALADFEQWAGPLADTIARVLSEDLALLIPTERVVLYPWPRTIDPDYQVTVEVLQFDRGPGTRSSWWPAGACWTATGRNSSCAPPASARRRAGPTTSDGHGHGAGARSPGAGHGHDAPEHGPVRPRALARGAARAWWSVAYTGACKASPGESSHAGHGCDGPQG